VKPDEGKDSSDDAVRADSEALIKSTYESYLSDESGLGPGTAQTIFFPTNEKQIGDFLREMNDREATVTISGGRTGIVGGAVPNGGALMSLERMNQILGITWDGRTREWRVTAEPGIILRDFQDRIAKKDLRRNGNSPDPNWRDLPLFQSDSKQYLYAPDPTEESASLGGTVATDASGARTYFFGRTRKHIRAIRLVLATGDVLSIRRGDYIVGSSRMVEIQCLDGRRIILPIPEYDYPDVKSAAGYYSRKNMDLIDLFIGSEGTLGVVTSIEVALVVAPSHAAMFLAFFPSQDDAVGFVLRIRSHKLDEIPFTLHSMEYLDSNSLNLLRRLNHEGETGIGIKLPDGESWTAILSEFAYEDLEKAVHFLQGPLEEFRSSLQNAIAGIGQREKDKLRALRHMVPEAINRIVAKRKFEVPGIHKFGTDTAVRDDRLQPLIRDYSQRLEASGLEYYLFGHIAENHLHVNLLPRNTRELDNAERLVRELLEKAVSLGGTVSAEHGIGKMKGNLVKVMFTDADMEQMVATKRALDPNLVLCPGNIFPLS
jgi:D-lactate dehydrogenase (cytochrome)